MSRNLRYQISGDNQQCLQIILSENESVIVDNSSICWFSEDINLETIDSFWVTMVGERTGLLCASNKSASPTIIGLSYPCNGCILALHTEDSTAPGLYCFRESFVAADCGTLIENKPFPHQS